MAREAANNIFEGQLLNFLVNTLIDEFTVDFGANAEIEAGDLFKVLIGAE